MFNLLKCKRQQRNKNNKKYKERVKATYAHYKFNPVFEYYLYTEYKKKTDMKIN